MTAVKKYLPFFLVYGIFLTIIWAFYHRNLQSYGGPFVYGLDDPYIHLSIARNLMERGIWGVFPGEFGFSASSLLWPLAIWAFATVTHIFHLAPLLLNVIFAGLLLAFVNRVLANLETPFLMTFLVLFLIAFATPLPVLTVIGMEHVSHCFFTVLFVWLVARQLASPAEATNRELFFLTLASVVLGMTRYEAMFLMPVSTGLFAARGRYHPAFASLAGFLPILGFGLWSLSHGWYFLPNPVLLKGQSPDFSSLRGILFSLGYGIFYKLGQAPPVALLMIFSALFLLAHDRKRQEKSAGFFANLLFLAVATLHLQFAGMGWFFRYEAYLVAWGIFTVAVSWKEWDTLAEELLSPSRKRPVLLLAQYALGLTLAYRICIPMVTIPIAFINIFHQPIQVATFLKAYYPGAPVAVNDIGAVSFFASIKATDLWGLADMEMASAIRELRATPDFIATLAERRGVKIAVAYERLLVEYGGVPASWKKIGSWRISHNVICSQAEICFYAANSAEGETLRTNLIAFEKHLPPEVHQELTADGGALPNRDLKR